MSSRDGKDAIDMALELKEIGGELDDLDVRVERLEAHRKADRRWAEERFRRLSLKVQQIWVKLKNGRTR